MTKQYITAAEVAEQMGVSSRTGYRIVQQLNSELKEKGFITTSGKCPRKYFLERTYGMEVTGD